MSERDCKHGQLARSCEICELERERDEWHYRANESLNDLADAEMENERLKRRLAELEVIQ